jgi:hypothetical protein
VRRQRGPTCDDAQLARRQREPAAAWDAIREGGAMLGAGDVSTLERLAAWTLVVAYALSLVYELWRATAKAGTSRHDSVRSFLTQDLLLYVIAAAVITVLFAGLDGAAWIGFFFCVAFILVSIFYYNPKIMLERRPALIDWFEDLTYTGWLFVAGALLLMELLGWRLDTGGT